MGLDITALKEVSVKKTSSSENDPIKLYVNPGFDRHDGMKVGKYFYNSRFDFRAGSYSSYNNWRENLAKISGWPPKFSEYRGCLRHDESVFQATEGPFFELIMFSDCEGFIGPKTSAKLLGDFERYQEKVDEVGDMYFSDLYSKWRTAFEFASQNGAVRFS